MPCVIPIAAFDDNYIWLIRDDRHAAAIDPGDADPVLSYLREHSLQLVAILNTHHHPDHTGGNAELAARFPVTVYGPAREGIAEVTRPVAEGETVFLPQLALQLSVLDIPGHTAGHVAYYGANWLFCGDTLFGCGCGRLFDGTPAQMASSLERLARLPEQTQVYCGHEYTLANIRFARAVEPGNLALQEREVRDRASRAQGLPTLPSSIGLEKRTNPFLRCCEPEVIRAASQFAGKKLADPIEVFAALRQHKNTF